TTAREVTLHGLDELIVIDSTRHRHDELTRGVVGAVVMPDTLARCLADGLGASSDGPTKTVVAEDRLEKALAGDIAEVVLCHSDLFEDDLTLGLELLGVDDRRRDHVGENV